MENYQIIHPGTNRSDWDEKNEMRQRSLNTDSMQTLTEFIENQRSVSSSSLNDNKSTARRIQFALKMKNDGKQFCVGQTSRENQK